MATAVKTAAADGLAQYLVANGFLRPEAAAETLAEAAQTDKRFEDVVVLKKLLDEEQLAQARAGFFGLPYADLRTREIPQEVMELIPAESMNFYNVVPFERDGQVLKVAVLEPGNESAIQALEFLGQKQNLQVQLHLASRASVDVAVGRKKNLKRVVGQALQDIEVEQQASSRKPSSIESPEQALNQLTEDAPIIKIVGVILSNAVEAGASDIHIEPTEKDVRVRYRIDGILHTSLILPRNVLSAVVTRIKILTNLKIDESRLPQDGRFHADVAGRSVDLRVSILPLINGEKVVMRILDKTGAVPTLEDLGLRDRNLTVVQRELKRTNGIFLITGPTGSGKSTTLYAVLSILNQPGVNIVTLEDPVEYFIEGVNQSQINPDIGLTFAAGLRSILRQDPNIIMVGEIRDRETAELAVHAALTGHLVFSTLHTNSATGAMPRLIDMGIEPFLLTASVNTIAAQRLVRKICTHCKAPVELPIGLRRDIEQQLQTIPKNYLEGLDTKNFGAFAGKGCDRCGKTGYQGRVGIFEVMPVEPDIQALILSKAAPQQVLDLAIRKGMITMKQDGVLKVIRGETTMEEIIRVTTV